MKDYTGSIWPRDRDMSLQKCSFASPVLTQVSGTEQVHISENAIPFQQNKRLLSTHYDGWQLTVRMSADKDGP